MNGKYQVEGDRIVISDKNAILTLKFNSPSLGFLARGISKSATPARVHIELDGKPVYETFADRDAGLEESGLSFVSINDLSFYLLLKGLRHTEHELKMIFSQSELTPVALYRIVLGN